METLYEKASLILNPGVYDTSKVYATKPFDGSGDLTFTRSNDTATRVNSAGLIEKVRTNLALYSEDFTNAAWAVNNSTKTTSQTDPNSGTTAVKIISTATVNSGIYQTKTASSTTRTASLWMKGEVGGEVVQYGDATNRATATLTTSWVRYSFAATDASAFFVIYNETASPLVQTWYVAFVQYENGDIATDYIATTSAAVSVGPVANVPRLDYSGGSSCPRLLLEPQRTNLITFSEQLDNAAWNKLGITVAANNTTSPSGYIDADKLIADAGTGNRVVYQGVVPVGVSTTTVYAKAGEFGGIVIASGTQGAFFNLTTGAYRAEYNSAPTAYNITSASNGWYRCSVTMTSVSGDNLYIGPNDNVSTLLSITGDGTSGIYAWGAQLEAGAYATSYIGPTLGSAVTRGADDCVKSSATSTIGQTEGVVYFEWEYQNVGSSGGNIVISLDGAGGDEIYFWVQTNGTYNFDVGDSGSGVVGISGSMGSFGTKKIAFAYKNNDFALYINGVLAGTDTSGTVPTCNRLYVGRYWANTSYNIASGIKQVLLFKTRLSNADLAALTA
jgi:hypothetical protein